jgi:hypothetical protein
LRSLARPDCSGRPEDEAAPWTILERVRPTGAYDHTVVQDLSSSVFLF